MTSFAHFLWDRLKNLNFSVLTVHESEFGFCKQDWDIHAHIDMVGLILS